MNILVTAGNTQVLIDRVRCITNIFTGRTGAGLALEAARRGHAVTILTSHPDTLSARDRVNVAIRPYCTFEQLHDLMATLIPAGGFDTIVHAAAVSDYLSAGIFAPAPGTHFEESSSQWQGPGELVDRAAGKVKSDEPELWLRLRRAPKLVDRIRGAWRFNGTLVKFKLEVGVGEPELLDIAERSRLHSKADWMVANTLEDAGEWAFVGPFGEHGYRRVARVDLAAAVLDAVESTHATHGGERCRESC